MIVFTSTFLINHFELFGLHQVTNHLAGREMSPPVFRTPLLYKFVRHPIYLGFIIAFCTDGSVLVKYAAEAFIYLDNVEF